jgi:hypothetical protein
MVKWRPEEWESLVFKIFEKNNKYHIKTKRRFQPRDWIEASADAILEALRKQPVCTQREQGMYGDTYTFSFTVPKSFEKFINGGKWVFIPNDDDMKTNS